MAPSASTLAGCKIFVGRDPQRAAPLCRLLESRGAVVVARELVRMESMVGEARPQRVIDDIENFDWILLTSVNGFLFFNRALQARGIKLGDLPARIGVVGPATAQALLRAGVASAIVARDARAEGLAASLEGELQPNDRVLVVRPESTRAVLQELLEGQGADVTAVPFYRSRPAANLEAVVRELTAGDYDAAVFAAPSAFNHLLAQCGAGAYEKLERLALVAIGEVTAEAITGNGCRVAAVALQPTPKGITNALEEALS